MKRWVAALLMIFGVIAFAEAQEGPSSKPVVLVDIKGVIGVATAMQVSGALEEARAKGAELIVLRVDTPGGLVSATRVLIQDILASPVPIVAYVAPSGARAVSAGTYIAYSVHFSAMAPGTHLGAATPIQLGGFPEPSRPSDRQREERGEGEGANRPAGAAERKAVNDAIAYLRSLAQLRGRNVEWAEKAVSEAATLTAEDAVRERVVDIIAANLNDLLAQLDGRVVKIGASDRRLAIKDSAIVSIEPDWRIRFLQTITDPNVAFILLMIGVYGFLFEFMSPGAFVPGVIGVICLLLGLAALAVLPVNYAGLGLLLTGGALMVAEALTAGVGALGFGGVVAFILGGIFLFDPAGADVDFKVAWPVILGAAVVSALFLLVVARVALRARRLAVVTGPEEMIGLKGRVVSWKGLEGQVHVHGEMWAARGDKAFAPGDEVRVVTREGLTLFIQPA